MRKKQFEILLVIVAALAMSAGVVATLLASRLASAGDHPPTDRAAGPAGGPQASFERTLADELDLRPEQREAMREIWEGVRSKVHGTFEQAQGLQKERDEALVALLNEEQRVIFSKISQDYARRFEQLTRQRDETFEKAVEATKRMLDEAQRLRYEQILRTHVRREPPPGIGPGARATPATQTAP